MSLSDERFAYGPFAPHWVPKQYIQNYFTSHRTDRFLVLNTTVEDVSRDADNWKLTLRRYDAVRKLDVWWAEHFDAVVIANGHYSVPYVRPSLLPLFPYHTQLTHPSSLPSPVSKPTSAPSPAESRTRNSTAQPRTTPTKRSSSSATRPQATTSRSSSRTRASSPSPSTNPAGPAAAGTEHRRPPA